MVTYSHRARQAAFIVAAGVVVGVGFLATTGSGYIAGAGLPVGCSPGERPEWDGSAWQCAPNMNGKLTAGRYYAMPNAGTAISTSAVLTNGVLRCVPAYIPNRITIARMEAGITSAGDAGSKLRLCVFADDGSGRPGSLVVDATTINGDSATDQEIVFDGVSGRPSPTSIGPGYYDFCGVLQNITVTSPTVRVLASVAGIQPLNVDLGATMPTSATSGFSYAMNGVTGACPSTFVYTATATTTPRIIIKTQ